MYVLFENLTKKQAGTCGLVLASAGLVHRVERNRSGGGGWVVWVRESQYERALDVMDRYFAENRQPPPDPGRQPPAVTRGMVLAGALVCLLILMAPVWADSLTADPKETVNRFGASASHILDGDVYRAVTALFLHADDAHLAGNLIGLFVFGTAVCAVAGWGMGWLMILACGIAGNLVNAWMYESAHVSIGASTAVFGAVGILTGYQVLSPGRPAARLRAALLPLACGLALLGMLGSSGERVDIMAHLFGFCCGLMAGLAVARALKQMPGPAAQAFCAAAAAGIVALAWAGGGKL